MVRSLFIALLLVAAAPLTRPPGTRAATVPAFSLDGLARSADAVLRGTVVAEHPLWHRFGDGPTRLYTVTEVRVRRVLKGAAADSTVLVLQMGGVDGGLSHSVPGTARLMPGDEVLVFTRTDGAFHYLVGMAQGAFVLSASGGTTPPTPTWRRTGLPNLAAPAPGAPVDGIAADVWLEGALEAAIAEALAPRGGGR
jgi:hypothetical protein